MSRRNEPHNSIAQVERALAEIRRGHMVILTDEADQLGVLSPSFSTPLQLAALVVFTAVGAVPVAAVSYYFIERPILKLKEPRSSKPAAAGQAPPPS